MKNMDRILKWVFIAIYLLFLITVWMLFAVANKNAIVPGFINIFIFMTLVLGTGIFGIALLNMKIKSHDEEIDHTEKEIIKNENTVEVAEKEPTKEIDINQILSVSSKQIDGYTDEILQNMAESFNFVQALFYVKQTENENFNCIATYAYFADSKPEQFKSGETLPGQAVKNKTVVILNNIPDNYMTIVSGLGKSLPKQLVFVPVKHEDEVVGIIEYATFEAITDKQQKALDAISKKIADAIVKLLKK